MRSILLNYIFLFTLTFSGLSQSHTEHFEGDYFSNLRFAHRGGYANGPENTISTILGSIQRGNHALEIDVQLTKDGHLVLFHDGSTERLLATDRSMNIADLTLDEFVRLPMRDKSQGVQYPCSLGQLLDTLILFTEKDQSFDFLLEIDFKPHGEQAKIGVDALFRELEKRQGALNGKLSEYFFVSTFYPDVLKEIYDRNTDVRTAFAVNSSPNESKFMAKIAVLLAPYFVKKYEVSIFEPNMCLITKRYVRKWQRKGILINTYTANAQCEKQYLEQFDIAYTSNCPLELSCAGDPSDEPGKAVKWCKTCRKKKCQNRKSKNCRQ
jgi:glycerophosphoryl diester phosphodiesterase